MKSAVTFGIVLVALVAPGLTATAPQTCESLVSLKTQNTTITLAAVVPPNGFSRPASEASPAQPAFTNPVAFCRVAATLKPSSDSDIKIEVWMPLSGWNGKYQAVGNGGWAGTISYPA